MSSIDIHRGFRPRGFDLACAYHKACDTALVNRAEAITMLAEVAARAQLMGYAEYPAHSGDDSPAVFADKPFLLGAWHHGQQEAYAALEVDRYSRFRATERTCQAS